VPSVKFKVQMVIAGRLAAVDLVHALAHARLLVENGPAHAQEFDVNDFPFLSECADVEHLTVAFDISVVASDNFVLAGKGRHWEVIRIAHL